MNHGVIDHGLFRNPRVQFYKKKKNAIVYF